MLEKMCISLPAELSWCFECHFIPARVDCGAAGNFLGETVTKLLKTPFVPLTGPLTVKALDRSLMGGGKVIKHTIPLQMFTGMLHA